MAEKEETIEEKVARLEKELGEAHGLIDEQTEQLELKQLQTAGTLPVISHDKVQYQVLAAKFSFKDVEYTADALASNADLVKQLLEAKSGVLQKIEKPKK